MSLCEPKVATWTVGSATGTGFFAFEVTHSRDKLSLQPRETVYLKNNKP